MLISYLGPPKTFTEQKAKELFPNEVLVSIQPIRKVILSVENNRADFGVVPLDNYYNGEVRETLDSLIECKNTKIIQESSSQIVHCLGVLNKKNEIKEILSKDQALEQCSKYICNNYPDVSTISVSSTAEAISIISRENRLYSAAIASKSAIISGGLKILDEDICPNNKTRFVVIGKDILNSSGDDKTLLAIHPPVIDKPGVLYNSLKFFYDQEINLECIQSRPDGKNGHYFYLEIIGHIKDKKVELALENLCQYFNSELNNGVVKILGSYRNTRWKDLNTELIKNSS